MTIRRGRGEALPLSALGREMAKELVVPSLTGVLQAGVMLWLFPLNHYPSSHHIGAFLGHYLCARILQYLRCKLAANTADSHIRHNPRVRAAVGRMEVWRTNGRAIGYAAAFFLFGPGLTAIYWVLVSVGFLCGGCAVTILLGLAANKLHKQTSSSMALAVRQATARLIVMCLRGLVWTVNTLLYEPGYCRDVVDSLWCFALPWFARRAGESLEKRRWQHNWSAVQEFYKHERLDNKKKQIRLLRIPRQRLFWGHLRCALITVSLDELPPFEALSYRWGFAKTTDPTELIFIDERPLIIPSSAYQLVHACSSVSGDRLVWIDAICINQTDAEEQSRQLPLMKDIYSKAKKVIVWPGDEWDSGMAMGMINRVLSAALTFEASEEEMGDFFEDECDRRPWKAMLKLLENPYFTRMWVIQEVVRGSNVEVYHGGYSLSWEAFALAVEMCVHPRRRSSLYGSRQPSIARNLAITKAAMGVDLMSLFRVAAEEKTLGALHIGHLLAATAKSQAKDPRDKVFALSGLLSDHALPGSLLDYTKSASEVFLETAKLVLEQERDPYALFGFAGIGWHSNLRDLPSWAVDWSRSEMPIPFWEGFYADYLNGEGEWQRPLPARRRPRIRMHTDGKPYVFARGTIVDRVAKDIEAVAPTDMAEATATTSHQFSRDRSEWYLKAKDLLEKKRQHTYAHTGQPLDEAFWRTIVADRSGLTRPAPAYFEACNRIYEKLSRVRVEVYEPECQEPLRIRDYPELRDIWPTELDAEAELLEFMHAIPRSTENRKFIVGERGFLGLAPPLSKVGDMICLLDGGPTPFILREQEDDSGLFSGCYYLVGECYVHGLNSDVDVEQSSSTFIIT